jgi:hypothetical protein
MKKKPADKHAAEATRRLTFLLSSDIGFNFGLKNGQ